MSAKHTPGPWRVGDAGATVFGPPNGNPSPETVANVRNIANARLIASAPDLYAALKRTIDFVQCERGCSAFTGHGDVCTCGARNVDLMIHAALRKAEGE